MKKYGGKYFSIVLKPDLLGQQRFTRDLIKKVNEIRLQQGLKAIDNEDLELRGWQGMSVKERTELTKRRLEKHKNEGYELTKKRLEKHNAERERK